MFRLENVAKTYKQGEKTVTALQSTTLGIESGEFISVVGASGSGKSTLLTLLGGMLAPTQGKVWFDGQSLYDLSVTDRAKLKSGPDVTFEALMPRPGNYRIWTQFLRGDSLTTVSFTVRAERLR